MRNAWQEREEKGSHSTCEMHEKMDVANTDKMDVAHTNCHTTHVKCMARKGGERAT